MNKHDDHFSPDHVDEQIEQLSPSQLEPAKDLLRALHLLYEEEKEEDTRSLDRAWSRIAAVDDQQQRNRSQNTVRSIMMKEPGTFSVTPLDRPLRQPLRQRLAILAAVACLAILVGGAAFLSQTMTNGKNTNTGSGGPGHITPTPVGPGHITPTPVGPGHITPTPMPSGQVTPTPMPSGQVTPTPMPSGQVTPTPVPSGRVTPTPMPSGQVTPTPMPSGQVTPTPVGN